MARALPLNRRLALLDSVLTLGAERVDPDRLAAAAAVRRQADERLARGDQLIVAALCGGTGSGKSSLFNALVGEELAPVGVQRPTTSEPRAWSVGEPGSAAPLLDWLGVDQRHEAAPGPDAPEGLVLVDLPDHDSVVAGHRATVDAFVERVDVVVWVLDPLKYSHRSVHEEYFRRLTEHAEVLLVVLNRIDELGRDDRELVHDDLRRLLAEQGLGRARVLLTSARTGEGVKELRGVLHAEARRRHAAAQRLAADIRAAVAALSADVGDADTPSLDTAAVHTAVADAVGIGAMAEASAAEYRAAGRAATRTPVARVIARLLAAIGRLVHGAQSLLPHRSPAREPSPTVAPVAVQHAVLQIVDRLAADLPVGWRRRLRSRVPVDGPRLARALADAVEAVPLRPPRRSWWAAVAILLSLAEAAALVGLGWLLVLGAVGWLQLPAPPAPEAVGAVPWPTALLLGGAAVRVLGGLVRRRLLEAGAARHRAGVSRRLRTAAERVAEREIAAPLREELDARERLRAALTQAAA